MRDGRELPLVLIVDDYEDSRRMSAEFLSLSGFDVAEARDGLEAVQQAAKLQPDVILMDYMLPQIDGWEAARRIKADARSRNAWIVGLTGFSEAEQRENAEEAGVDSFITKPCPPDKMVEEVRRLLDAGAH